MKKDFIGYIYKISNSINDKIYIGQTRCSIERRFNQHKQRSRKKSKYNSHLYEAMRKYGEEVFQISILEVITTNLNDLYEREKYWIKFYDTTNNKLGYNIDKGGRGGDVIHLLSQDRQERVKNILRIKSLGKKQSQETINKRVEKLRNRVTIHKSDKMMRVSKECLNEYLDDGWEVGMPIRYIDKSHNWQSDIHKQQQCKDKISKKSKNRFKGYIRVVNSSKNRKLIHPNELNKYLEMGYHRGTDCENIHSHKGQILVQRDDVRKYIDKVDIDKYLNDSWNLVRRSLRLEYGKKQ